MAAEFVMKRLLSWAFNEPQPDKRLARSALLIWSGISFVAAICFLVANLL